MPRHSWFDDEPQATAGPVQTAPATGSAGGLPPGAHLNPDGSVTLADGTVIGMPAGMVRDPQTGILRPAPGAPRDNAATSAAQSPLAVPQGNYQAVFDSLFPDATLTPQLLASKEAELARYGIKLNRNASGLTTDLTLPDGTIVDPIQGAGSGLNRKQWLVQGKGGSGNQAAAAPDFPRWGEQFSYGDFTPPSGVTEENDPGFKTRMQAGLDAIERAASAKGTLLTGGTLREENQWAQDYGSHEYSNVYARAADTYKQNYGKALTAYGTKYNEFLNRYSQTLGENELAYGRMRGELSDEWNRYYGLADLGLRGAVGANAAGANYANAGSDLTTGAGNARAAGIVGGANAWNQGLGSLANLGMFYSTYGRGGRNPYGYGGADGGYGGFLGQGGGYW